MGINNYIKFSALSLAVTVAISSMTFADGQGFTVTELGDAVCYHTETQAEALMDDSENILNYCDGLLENSKPQGVKISWSYDKVASDGFTVNISTSEDMADAFSVSCTSDAVDGLYSCSVKNLLINTTYYYTITDNAADVTSDVYTFAADNDFPRNLDVDGITNVRDMGGWPLANGGTERQGMVYRGGRLNENESDEIMITDEGKETMLEVMGIKTEIDFRTVDDNENGGITVSPLGESVTYYSMPWDASSISDASDMIRDIIALFADEANYPIYFHCSIGTDRTGFIAAVIHGLLGVSEEDIYKDYVFSDFGEIGSARQVKNMRNRVEKNIKVCEGSTLQEQTRNFLLSIGVTEEQMDSIVSILTEQ